MSDIPEEVRRQVIRAIYRRADQLDWDGLTQSDRTKWYNQWLDEEPIGGVILRYLPRERARGWVKDVPMKHYARARAGLGPYADLACRRLPGPDQIVRQVFGAQWEIIDGTIKEKPNRCRVSDGETVHLMIWGPLNNLSSLIWCGINAVVDRAPTPVIVVTLLQGQRISEGEKARHATLGRQAGLEVVHTVLRQVNDYDLEPPIG
ncbi:hypothetical protein ACF060_19595 [Streptomyces werraensis]|uniref:hypothetical protein n=1 Tax=Streptomyces werraensis TaxID=68284 RepID=UPI0036F994E2